MVVVRVQEESDVSTHSHPKVAAPPRAYRHYTAGFQHTATRRWLLPEFVRTTDTLHVSTHSHPKVAANKYLTEVSPTKRFNTQPPEGGCISNLYKLNELKKVSTHSHPKVATPRYTVINDEIDVSTHSHPKVAAARSAAEIINIGGFQHTATRRWLLNGFVYASCYGCVSTHSHPKVAAHRGRKHKNHQATFQHTATRRWLPGALRCMQSFAPSFNTQPPEGGCTIAQSFNWAVDVSTHSHPKVAALVKRRI